MALSSYKFFRTCVVIAAALLTASLLVLAVSSKPAEAAFPGKNGKIAFASNRASGGNLEIYAMSNVGTGEENLTESTAGADYAARYSRNGKSIVFQSTRDGGSSEIYRMSSTGLLQTRLTKNPASDLEPSYSPDGKNIAFVSGRDGNAEIYRMSSTGDLETNLTNNPASDSGPTWQPLP